MSALLATTSSQQTVSTISNENLSEALRIRKKRFEGDANCKSQTILKTMRTMSNKILLQPVYQRDICWNIKEMCDLILTIMESGLIPSITVYKYQRNEEFENGKTHECVDGQHRMFSIMSFYNGDFVIKKKMITFQHIDVDGKITHVFYKKNQNTTTWTSLNPDKRVSYFSEEERDDFNNYTLDIKEINGEMSIDDRRKLFLSLSKGRAVTGVDLEKNHTDIPLVKFISETMNLEKDMKSIIVKKCYVAAEKYWLHWTIRLFKMMNIDETEEVRSFLITDKQIKAWIKNKNLDELSISEDEGREFKTRIENFFSFLKKTEYKMSPTHFFALFNKVNDHDVFDEDYEMKLLSHVKKFNSNKKMWEKKSAASPFTNTEYQQKRESFYNEVKSQIDNIIDYVPDIDNTKIGKRLKREVWKTWNGNNIEGKCFCCKDTLFDHNFVGGHKAPRRDGGKTELNNLRPICSTCNNEMGQREMYQWMTEKGYEILSSLY